LKRAKVVELFPKGEFARGDGVVPKR